MPTWRLFNLSHTLLIVFHFIPDPAVELSLKLTLVRKNEKIGSCEQRGGQERGWWRDKTGEYTWKAGRIFLQRRQGSSIESKIISCILTLPETSQCKCFPWKYIQETENQQNCRAEMNVAICQINAIYQVRVECAKNCHGKISTKSQPHLSSCCRKVALLYLCYS